jgi:hypothetical protein
VTFSVSGVGADARVVLEEELASFAEAQPSPSAAARYQALAAAVRDGDVPDDLLPALETFLELALHRGRLRRQRGAEADDALAALFFTTPGGSAARKAAHDVSRALGALAGQVVERINVAAVIGGHTVEIRTDHAQVVVELDRGGARFKSVEVGA